MYFIHHKIIMHNILIKNDTVNTVTDRAVSAASAGLVVWDAVVGVGFVLQCLLCDKHISLVP